jgi:hypothetical protein
VSASIARFTLRSSSSVSTVVCGLKYLAKEPLVVAEAYPSANKREMGEEFQGAIFCALYCKTLM